ncbi:MAG TPA: CDP-alcohol phosphatidyltransferase family protein [Candidatus Deferrimicrobium sp.]|nr:CDP-alcohol phosphatidyltransferase family protein [Candidatus Deferrimicrobium sp.]
MSEFEIFHLIYLIAISAITVIFLVHTFLTRPKLSVKEITFEAYFKFWLDEHEYHTPIEEIRGPLRPYLHAFFIAGKAYARLGITANRVSILGLIWALWTVECWFLGGSWILLATLFVIFSGSTDSIDGVVAFLTDTESKLGAYYDAVLDKFGDILWVLGPIYFLFTNATVLSTYSNFWLTFIVSIGIFGLLFAIIQEYCRARQQGLGLHANDPVIGERLSRLGFVITLTACIGISNFLTFLNPSPGFQNVNIWMHTYIIPICFIVLLAFAIISIIQFNNKAVKELK